MAAVAASLTGAVTTDATAPARATVVVTVVAFSIDAWSGPTDGASFGGGDPSFLIVGVLDDASDGRWGVGSGSTKDETFATIHGAIASIPTATTIVVVVVVIDLVARVTAVSPSPCLFRVFLLLHRQNGRQSSGLGAFRWYL